MLCQTSVNWNKECDIGDHTKMGEIWALGSFVSSWLFHWQLRSGRSRNALHQMLSTHSLCLYVCGDGHVGLSDCEMGGDNVKKK